MAWGKSSTVTLGSSGDTITSDAITVADNTFITYISHMISTGGNSQAVMRLGNSSIDTGNNYSRRYSTNGGADATHTSRTVTMAQDNAAGQHFSVGHIINISAEEKLLIGWDVFTTGTGAGTAPNRDESVGKYAYTSNQVDLIEMINEGGAGDYDTDSNLAVLGTA
jgi:hypothetical protein